ncbi:3-keto-disaccharide hydrolase [Sphingobacterium spiritivorum]|uniref:3-keto-disaccharide hydrolase n=1 Tax=Sphingobacterium spiritivorum TaxID=258 RepID=UPI003DA257F3
MKRNLFLYIWIALLTTGGCSVKKAKENTDTTTQEWKSLFNGKDINDWNVKIHHHDFGVNYGHTFRVQDGMIQVRYDEYGDFNEQYGHLYYKTPYSYYHLKLEYRFVGELHSGAPDYTLRNSGVMFHSQDPATMPREQDWPISVEMQFLGGLGDGKPRPTGNMCSPGTHVVYKGKIAASHCLNSTSKTYDGNQWVSAELIVLGDSLITHIIEGDTVLQYSKPQIGGGVANRYDPGIKIDGQLLKSGFIALQSEGQPVDFRNIRIKDLSSQYRH